MPPILGSHPTGKNVMTGDGTMLGELSNVTMDLQTGDLAHPVVEPDGDLEYDERYGIDDGRCLVPSHEIRDVQDYITVE